MGVTMKQGSLIKTLKTISCLEKAFFYDEKTVTKTIKPEHFTNIAPDTIGLVLSEVGFICEIMWLTAGSINKSLFILSNSVKDRVEILI